MQLEPRLRVDPVLRPPRPLVRAVNRPEVQEASNSLRRRQAKEARLPRAAVAVPRTLAMDSRQRAAAATACRLPVEVWLPPGVPRTPRQRWVKYETVSVCLPREFLATTFLRCAGKMVMEGYTGSRHKNKAT